MSSDVEGRLPMVAGECRVVPTRHRTLDCCWPALPSLALKQSTILARKIPQQLGGSECVIHSALSSGTAISHDRFKTL